MFKKAIFLRTAIARTKGRKRWLIKTPGQKTKKMWRAICLILMIIVAADAVVILPGKSAILVGKGEVLKLNCSSKTSGTELKWQRKGINLETDEQINLEITGRVADGGDNVSFLSHTGVDSTNAGGVYTCFDTKNVDTTDATINVRIVEVSKEGYLFQYKQGGVLSCSVSNLSSGEKATYKWKRNGIVISDSNKYKDHGNGTLELIKDGITREEAGIHECEVEVMSSGTTVGTFDIPVILYAKPLVIPMDKSVNKVQDEALGLECRVLGYPAPNVTWFKDNVEIKAGDPRIKMSEHLGIANAYLTISSVDFDDAGVYDCVATATDPMFDEKNDGNVTASSNSHLIVRVKDKLAALWPFLGIVAEVVILCTIIFIYEKKRNKDAAAEDEVNQDGAAPEKSKEGVRHRGNTNNPRA